MSLPVLDVRLVARPAAPQAGADRLQGSGRCPGHDMAHPRGTAGHRRAPPGTAGHRRAKTITNCVANRWVMAQIPRPGSAAGPPGRTTRHCKACWPRVDDHRIATAIRAVRDLEQRWLAVPPGGTLRLRWPLARDFFPGPG